MPQSILVFSHLRWNFVYQRPQHLMSRLAKTGRVIFFEEPVFGERSHPHIITTTPLPNVLVCQAHTPVKTLGFHDEQLPYLHPLLQKLMRDEKWEDFYAWFYTPMALPLIQDLGPRAIIYDCMDELSAFLGAPRQLLQRETALLKAASIVFAGGPSLYRAKKDRHLNVHCVASSVDAAHFAKSSDSEPEAQAALPHPLRPPGRLCPVGKRYE